MKVASGALTAPIHSRPMKESVNAKMQSDLVRRAAAGTGGLSGGQGGCVDDVGAREATEGATRGEGGEWRGEWEGDGGGGATRAS